MPDEINIVWSSGKYNEQPEIASVLNDYALMSGWMASGSKLIDGYGRYIDITSGLIGKHNDVWIGTSDGTLFRETKQWRQCFQLNLVYVGQILMPCFIMMKNFGLDLKDTILEGCN